MVQNITHYTPATIASEVRLAFSINEAARKAGIGRDRIYSAIRSGDLTAKKFGRRTLILATDLDDFLLRLPPLELGPKSKDDPGNGSASSL